MKTKFKHQNVHHCEAVVLTCIDFRFWRETLEFIENELKIKAFDFPSLPGAAKAINESSGGNDIAVKCISVPCDLHSAEKIVIVNHEDCGAYGGSAKFNGDQKAEFEFHIKELKKAKEKISAKYPRKEIILAYAKLTDNKQDMEFLMVN